jgi:hypothetical protein
MAKKHVWKVLLQRIKGSKGKYTAKLLTQKTLNKEDIARNISRILKKKGSDVSEEQVLSIINTFKSVYVEQIRQGCNVQNGVFNIKPRMSGNWLDCTDSFSPDKHMLTFDQSPSEELRKSLEKVKVEVVGVEKSDAYIRLVTDVESGDTEGDVTPGGNIVIDGAKIRIAPVDGEGLGIFFMNADGLEIPVTHPLIQNDPKQIICRVPVLEPGEYVLKIVTQFSHSSKLLKTPRTIVYGMMITVGWNDYIGS